MKRTSTLAGRFALTGIALAAACLGAGNAMALGLGRLSVQSALGESLRAEIDITTMTPEEAASMRVRIATPDAFRAAGVDYNAVLPGTQAVLLRRSDGRPYLRLTSNRPVQEPFVDVILEVTWPSGRLVREYTMLFDPPTLARAPESVPVAPATPARITAAPVPPAPALAAAPTPPRTVERRAPPAPLAQAPAPAGADPARPPPATGSAGGGADEYRVRPGDSLTRIATRTQRAGVSLDQMLVALFRSNPAAFIESNMNRLRAGAVLSVPSAEAAGATPASEARQVIQAQSADFGAYRQRLAGGVPTARADAPTRQASGKVEAQVDDRRAGAATVPDRLTLSRGGAATSGSDEARISRDRAAAAASGRLGELSRNVNELVQAASSAATSRTPVGGAAPAPGTLVAAAPMAAAPAPATALPAPAPSPAASSAMPAVTVATPGVAASAVALPAPMASASGPMAAAVAASAARVVPPPPAVAVATGKSTGFTAWMEENPLLLAAGAALVALLGGLGIYRLTQRARRDSGETSFLESRLQPDSFFGASGGQRIDTRDAGTASSSMSYSLSQLDAIGDVDPVAEADVYLAYGRDLQAEEILKEAMRSTPERPAIRTKLLEVYAKRRDTKAFELLAAQLFALTRGQGDDWAKAQEMGSLIDSDNPMYRPGGMPANLPPTADRAGEALGVSTMPQSVMPASSSFRSAFDATTQAPPATDLDLDLDHANAAASAYVTTQAFAPEPRQEAGLSGPMNFDLSAPDLSVPNLDSPDLSGAPALVPAPAATRDQPLAFDLSSISLDLDPPSEPTHLAARSPAPAAASTDFELPHDGGDDADDSDDPISRKLDLAEEFRQIGDMDGARDLLQEVVAKSSGAVKARAQGMLDEIS
ncbi:MAG: FimV/HubP family polar landmark protein [Burkholderiaceae bacterium]